MLITETKQFNAKNNRITLCARSFFSPLNVVCMCVCGGGGGTFFVRMFFSMFVCSVWKWSDVCMDVVEMMVRGLVNWDEGRQAIAAV